MLVTRVSEAEVLSRVRPAGSVVSVKRPSPSPRKSWDCCPIGRPKVSLW
ncbi:MAG: hypothetical protein R3A52_25770 [Polyangiales bacterium]